MQLEKLVRAMIANHNGASYGAARLALMTYVKPLTHMEFAGEIGQITDIKVLRSLLGIGLDFKNQTAVYGRIASLGA